jgi:hypothetical protein
VISCTRSPIPQVDCFLRQDQDRVEFIRPDLLRADLDSEMKRRPEVEGVADQQSSLRSLRSIQFVQRAAVAPGAVVGPVAA